MFFVLLKFVSVSVDNCLPTLQFFYHPNFAFYRKNTYLSGENKQDRLQMHRYRELFGILTFVKECVVVRVVDSLNQNHED
jgi:hypothetical protein